VTIGLACLARLRPLSPLSSTTFVIQFVPARLISVQHITQCDRSRTHVQHLTGYNLFFLPACLRRSLFTSSQPTNRPAARLQPRTKSCTTCTSYDSDPLSFIFIRRHRSSFTLVFSIRSEHDPLHQRIEHTSCARRNRVFHKPPKRSLLSFCLSHSSNLLDPNHLVRSNGSESIQVKRWHAHPLQEWLHQQPSP